MMRFHTQTAGVTLTAQQPDNNVIRTTLQALSAVLGGTQSLHVNSKDEALALPTEESVQISLRTQQILAHEIGASEVVDPLAGSYFVEHLTDELERKAFEYIEKIEDMGGAVEALKEGFQIVEIHDSAYIYQQEVESKDRIVVGVNEYVSDAPHIEALQTISKAETERQLKRLARVKSERNNELVLSSLSDLAKIARDGSNTVPGIIDCVEAYCTVGEISDVFRDIYGEQKEFTPF